MTKEEVQQQLNFHQDEVSKLKKELHNILTEEKGIKNLKGKYIYFNSFGCPTYMYVNSVGKDGIYGPKLSYGALFNIINSRSFEVVDLDMLDKIKVITKEEFMRIYEMNCRAFLKQLEV